MPMFMSAGLSDVCACAFGHTQQMLCGNEMAEKLSWISWVAAYQVACPMCGLTSRTRQTLRRFTYIYNLSVFSTCISTVHKQPSIHSSCGLSGGEWSWERLCVSVCTQWHPFIFVWMWLLCIKGCALHGPNLLAEGVVHFRFTMDLFSTVFAYDCKAEESGDMNMAARPPTIQPTVVQSA